MGFLGFGGNSKDTSSTQDDSTDEEKAEQALKFHTASGRFGPVGKRDKTWKTSDE